MKDRHFVAYLLVAALVTYAVIVTVPAIVRPVQAAAPDPDVVPCDLINTATLSGGGVIEIFRCEPNEGLPYRLNSVGFMETEE